MTKRWGGAGRGGCLVWGRAMGGRGGGWREVAAVGVAKGGVVAPTASGGFGVVWESHF